MAFVVAFVFRTGTACVVGFFFSSLIRGRRAESREISLSLSFSPAGLSAPVYRCHSFFSFSLCVFFFRYLRKCAGYSYLTWRDKKWRLSRMGPFENLPIVRRRVGRPGFSGVRLERISARRAPPNKAKMLRESTFFASVIWTSTQIYIRKSSLYANPKALYIRIYIYIRSNMFVADAIISRTLTLPKY